MLLYAEFAYNLAVSEDLEISPSGIDFGWLSKALLDLVNGKEVPMQRMNKLKEKIRSSLNNTHFPYKMFKTRQTGEASHQYKTFSLAAGSRAWINTCFEDECLNFQESDKLGEKQFDHFTVIKLIGKSTLWRDLSSHMKICPVVFLSQTIPYVKHLEDI